jgi:hypothetical protein
MAAIDASMWGEIAKEELKTGELIVFKGVKVSDYCQKTLKIDADTTELFRVNSREEESSWVTNLPKVQTLKAWYERKLSENPESDISALLNHAHCLSVKRNQSIFSRFEDNENQ